MDARFLRLPLGENCGNCGNLSLCTFPLFFADVTLAGRTFPISRNLVRDTKRQVLEEHVANLRKALLVMHAPRDQTVGIEHASAIFAAAKHPKSFVSRHSADHFAIKRLRCCLRCRGSSSLGIAVCTAAQGERERGPPRRYRGHRDGRRKRSECNNCWSPLSPRRRARIGWRPR